MTRNFSVSKKTGFAIIDPNVPVIIRDYRGILFYSTEPYLPNVDLFNLPPGQYMVDSGKFKAMPEPVIYKLAKLPIPESLKPIPTDFDIIFANNPNKCSIFWKKKLIVFDNAFEDAPLPHLFFIYFHELGHARYGYDTFYTSAQAEKYADLYASNRMLEYGFNPSQVGETPILSLSDRQEYRKDFMTNVMLKNNGKNV